jgi:hypothetical protein
MSSKFIHEEKIINSTNGNELIFRDKKIYIIPKDMPDKYVNNIMSYTQWSPKVVLGGSISLYLLHLMDINYDERSPDIDFSLLEPFNKEELSHIINFFELSPRLGNDYGEPGDTSNVDKLLDEKLLLLSKSIFDDNGDFIDRYDIDFFQETFLSQRDIIPVVLIHKGYEYNLNLTQPSIILSYKARYALDTRIGKQYKHWNDIKELFNEGSDESKHYFRVMKKINLFLQKNK